MVHLHALVELNHLATEARAFEHDLGNHSYALHSEHGPWHSSSLVLRNAECLALVQLAAAIQHALPPYCPATSHLHCTQASARGVIIDT